MHHSKNMQDLNERKNEILELKKALLGLYKKKEEAFQQKEQLKREIYTTIADWRKIRDAIIASTKEKSELKKQRDTLNQKGKEMIEQAKELKEEKEMLLKKYGKTVSSHIIKEKIQKLETKIETEAMKFDQEKKIMQAIKELKKQLQTMETVRGTFKQSAALSKTIERTLEEADTLHKELFLKNLVDREKYNELKKLSKRIKEQKKKQEAAFNQFIVIKKEYLQKNEELKQHIRQLKPLLVRQHTRREQRKKLYEERNQQKLAELEQAVEEKLKLKKKITTEDLLVFQRK